MLFYSRNWANLSSGATRCVPHILRYRWAKIAIFENFAKLMHKTGSGAVRAVLNRFRRNFDTMLHTYSCILYSTDDFRRLPVLEQQWREVGKCKSRDKNYFRFLTVLILNVSESQKFFSSWETPYKGLSAVRIWRKFGCTVFGNMRFCTTAAFRAVFVFHIFFALAATYSDEQYAIR